ncbi:MAG: sulfatase-like hydrolase/transferase [Phycisphaeraceae bacterium]
MADRPNILFLMTDQMQGRVLEPDHPCQTPTFDALAARGVRLTRAYTPNAICSPARASLMTGLLPHTHRVVQVTHCQPPHMVALDRSKPHWAQRLRDAGYRTGYFGKWHVEDDNALNEFGWAYDGNAKGERMQQFLAEHEPRLPEVNVIKERRLLGVEGYDAKPFYGVNDRKPEHRGCGLVTTHALQWLDDGVIDGDDPWCCFVSVQEPHDPFIVGKDAYERYDPKSLPVPNNWHDDLAGRPGLYRKSARVFQEMSLAERKEAAACYFGMITEIDSQFARVIERVKQAGQLENTIVVLTSDHGEFLGAHGLYQKNVGAYEEAYNIPMVLAGPGIAPHGAVDARVGLHDLGATLIDLVGLNNFETPESRSFAPLLRDPDAHQDQHTTGYAEYYGGRYWYSQRIYWDGPWKLVWNGFDFDELYNLDDDPGETHNLIDAPEHAERVRAMMAAVWRIVRETDDHPLYRSNYPSLRLAPYGPAIEHDTANT